MQKFVDLVILITVISAILAILDYFLGTIGLAIGFGAIVVIAYFANKDANDGV
jgi:hypothetical protein